MIVTWNYSFFHRGTMMFFIHLNQVIGVRECLEISTLKALGIVLLAGSLSSLNEYGLIS